MPMFVPVRPSILLKFGEQVDVQVICGVGVTLSDPTDLPPGTATMRLDRLRELLALPVDGNPP